MPHKEKVSLILSTFDPLTKKMWAHVTHRNNTYCYIWPHRNIQIVCNYISGTCGSGGHFCVYLTYVTRMHQGLSVKGHICDPALGALMEYIVSPIDIW